MAKTRKIDLKIGNTPVDLSSIQILDDDCYGREWDNSHPTCVKCSAYNTCMVIQLSKGTQQKAAQIKLKTQHFFDELNWDAVPWFDIYEEIITNPGAVKYTKLFVLVKDLAKVIDDITAHSYIKNWLIENNIKIEDGCLYLSL